MEEISRNTELEEIPVFWFYEGKTGNRYTRVNIRDDYITIVYRIFIPLGNYKSFEELEEDLRLNSSESIFWKESIEKIEKKYPQAVIDKGGAIISGEYIGYLTIKNPDKDPEMAEEIGYIFLKEIPFYQSEVSSLQNKLDKMSENQDFGVFVDKNGNEVISGNEEELKEKGCEWVPLSYLEKQKQNRIKEKLLRYFKRFTQTHE